MPIRSLRLRSEIRRPDGKLIVSTAAGEKREKGAAPFIYQNTSGLRRASISTGGYESRTHTGLHWVFRIAKFEIETRPLVIYPGHVFHQVTLRR